MHSNTDATEDDALRCFAAVRPAIRGGSNHFQMMTGTVPPSTLHAAPVT
jgi:hypothetical protein